MNKETPKEKLELAKLNLEKAKAYICNVQRELVQAQLNVANEEIKRLKAEAADSEKTHAFLLDQVKDTNLRICTHQTVEDRKREFGQGY